jgi:hypothetical protein
LQYHPLIQGEDAPTLDGTTETAEDPKLQRNPRPKLGREEKIAYNKERRQRKRRRLALERLAAEGKASPEAMNGLEMEESDGELDEVDVDVDESDEEVEGNSNRGSPSSKTGE